MRISPENSIAYSVVRTRATLQEHARSPFRSKRRLPKQRRGRISRSRSYILLRATLPIYQNMSVINLQPLLLRQIIHKLPGLSSHYHHHCHLLIPEASSQKGTNTPNSSATSGRSLKLVQSIAQYQNPLPESKALPSVVFFAECLLSGTRQRRLCRVPHSVKLDSRQRGSLPSAGHSAQDDTRQRLVCRVSNTQQRGLSAKGRQRPSQS
jgi:hypothetical protein